MKKNMQLLVAAVAGLGAAYANHFYLEQERALYQNKREVTVLRTKKPIKAGQMVTPELVEPVKIPEMYAPKSVIRDANRTDAIGQIANIDIGGGDYVLSTYFSLRTAVGERLSSQVDSSNFRAITVPVDEVSSLSRSIQTGDRIDIVFTFNIPGTAAKFSTLLLQSVPVIATGSYSVSDQERPSADGGKRYGTLTLRLPPVDAMRLNYARQTGQISILLRKSDDNAAIEMQPITSLKDLLSASEREAVEKVFVQAANQVMSGDKLKDQVRELMERQRQQQVK